MSILSRPSRSSFRRRTLGAAVLSLAMAASTVAPNVSSAETLESRMTTTDSRYAPFATAEEFVEQQYVDILRRQPSTQEVSYQVGLLENGRAPADLIVEFVESPEANSNIKAVVRLYRAYYLRNPDFRGLSHWIQQRLQGTRLDTISTEFARAPEFALRYGVLNDDAFIDYVYKKVMRRDPDANGKAYWSRRLGSDIHRGQFMTLFSESAENVELNWARTTVVTLYHGMFQRSISLGRSDSLSAALRNGRTTTTELALAFLADPAYTNRF